MQEKDFDRLARKYLDGSASSLEKELVEAHLRILEEMNASELSADQLASHKAAVWKKLQEEKAQSSVHRVHFLRRYRWAAAAVFLLAVATTYLLISKKEPAPFSVYKNDVSPGRPGAKLKLNNGDTINLETAKDGVIAVEGGIKVVKKGDEIYYEGKATGDVMLYHELIADKKQRSSAVLPDGSIAWVNAASSVRYPVRFTGGERKVTMTGEAAFKVSHDGANPFRVYAGGQVFEDLGTQFNINAYSDEPVIRMTVLEGLVQTGHMQVHPNQQAQVDHSGTVKLVNNIETDQVFAWRDGQFNFSGANIEDIMKQVARWYDVEIVYSAKLNQQFTIGLNRDKPITEFLQALEQAGRVHFEVEGRRVTVKP